ncbi:hypothetical protein, partial [Providencia stuartii]|uniref:hypothetical protein n=1 Tax=Providencia stuartii TaxID=588 RepID=UPI00195409CE
MNVSSIALAMGSGNMGMSSSSFLLGFFNFIILISMVSAANSNIYFGSRCLLSMVEEGYFLE